jgi:hypothetical protein
MKGKLVAVAVFVCVPFACGLIIGNLFEPPIQLSAPNPPPAAQVCPDYCEPYPTNNDIMPELNDRQYVRFVYRLVLHRDPVFGDESGLSNWEYFLHGGQSRLWVLGKFLQSDEFKSRSSFK